MCAGHHSLRGRAPGTTSAAFMEITEIIAAAVAPRRRAGLVVTSCGPAPAAER